MTNPVKVIDFPTNWKIERFKNLVTRTRNRYTGTESLLSVYLEKGVIPFNEGGVDRVHNPSEDLSKYQKVNIGDFVMNNQQAWRGSVGISGYEGIISPAYYVYKLSPQIDVEFAKHLFRSQLMVLQYDYVSGGVGTIQRNLDEDALKNVLVPIPPIEEQRRISNYLDSRLDAIDGIQQKRNRQILALKEVSQGLTLDWVPNSINNVFVDKFESNTGMNIRAKYLFQELKVSNVDAPLASATMDGVVLREEMVTEVWNPQDSTQSYKLVEPGDFVINLRSFQHGFSYSEVRGKVSPAYTVFRLRHELLSKFSSSYFSYLFQSKQFIGQLESISVGIRQGRNIPYDNFANLLIPIPNAELRTEIEEQQLRNSARVALLMKSAGPLTELRQSLITSVVTGNSTQNI